MSKDTRLKERKVIIRGQIDTGKICPAGSDFCWECGFVAPAKDFDSHNRCPNPGCPSPRNWDD